MIAWLLGAALAGEPPVITALTEELSRSVAELALPNAERIYHLRYKVYLTDQHEVTASRGALLADQTRTQNLLGVEVRVGNPTWDNTGFGGWQDGFLSDRLPVDADPIASRRVAWRVTDAAYKDAIEQLSRKHAQVSQPKDHPGDYWMTGPVVSAGAVTPPPLSTGLSELALALSAPLNRPELDVGQVEAYEASGNVWILDSEGTSVSEPTNFVVVRAVGRVRLPDGSTGTGDRLWMARSVADLPARDALLREVSALADQLVAQKDAPLLDEEYVGPVVFEGQAAADLFRFHLLGQLEGTPADRPFESFFGDIGDEGGSVRVGRRVLPEGWKVVDDPLRLPSHPASFTHDAEGTPAQAVELVTDGIVRSLLMTRVPRKGFTASNGHARPVIYDRSVAQPSLTFVDPPRALSEPALERQALKLASVYGRDWVLVVRRLTEPSTDLYERSWSYEAPDGGLGSPIEAVKLFPDGHEEPVRGLAFSAVSRWALRDIVAAGKPVARDFLDAWDDDDASLGLTDGTPCRIVAPSVVVGEMELVAVPGNPKEARVVPPPGR